MGGDFMGDFKEPFNTFGIGRYQGSVAIGKGVHRMLSSKGALDLAYWLIYHADKETGEQREALSRILDLLLHNAKQDTEV